MPLCSTKCLRLWGSKLATLTISSLSDLGSGKGRTLLMASDYPFRRIVGVELLPALHQIAQEKPEQVSRWRTKKCFRAGICLRGCGLFNSRFRLSRWFSTSSIRFPSPDLRRVIGNLEQSLQMNPRAVYVLYHNPLLEHVLSQSVALKKIGRDAPVCDVQIALDN